MPNQPSKQSKCLSAVSYNTTIVVSSTMYKTGAHYQDIERDDSEKLRSRVHALITITAIANQTEPHERPIGQMLYDNFSVV